MIPQSKGSLDQGKGWFYQNLPAGRQQGCWAKPKDASLTRDAERNGEQWKSRPRENVEDFSLSRKARGWWVEDAEPLPGRGKSQLSTGALRQ